MKWIIVNNTNGKELLHVEAESGRKAIHLAAKKLNMPWRQLGAVSWIDEEKKGERK